MELDFNSLNDNINSRYYPNNTIIRGQRGMVHLAGGEVMIPPLCSLRSVKKQDIMKNTVDSEGFKKPKRTFKPMIDIDKSIHAAMTYSNKYAVLEGEAGKKQKMKICKGNNNGNSQLEMGLCCTVGICDGACSNFASPPIEGDTRVSKNVKNVNNKVYNINESVSTPGEDAGGTPGAFCYPAAPTDASCYPAASTDSYTHINNKKTPYNKHIINDSFSKHSCGGCCPTQVNNKCNIQKGSRNIPNNAKYNATTATSGNHVF